MVLAWVDLNRSFALVGRAGGVQVVVVELPLVVKKTLHAFGVSFSICE
jgi:hypothetical protein